jgi:hypothetical protein
MDWNWDTIRKRKQQWHLPTPPPTSYWASWVRALWPHHLALAKNATHLSPWRCDANNVKKLPRAPQQHEEEEKMMNKKNRNKNKKNHCHWSYYSWHSYETCSCRIAHAASSCHLLIFLLSQSTASIPPLHTTTRSGSTETLYSSQQVFNLNEFLWKWGRPIKWLFFAGKMMNQQIPWDTPDIFRETQRFLENSPTHLGIKISGSPSHPWVNENGPTTWMIWGTSIFEHLHLPCPFGTSSARWAKALRRPGSPAAGA